MEILSDDDLSGGEGLVADEAAVFQEFTEALEASEMEEFTLNAEPAETLMEEAEESFLVDESETPVQDLAFIETDVYAGDTPGIVVSTIDGRQLKRMPAHSRDFSRE